MMYVRNESMLESEIVTDAHNILYIHDMYASRHDNKLLKNLIFAETYQISQDFVHFYI